MNNAEVIQHKGKDVLVMDIANVKPVEVIKRIKAVEEKIVDFSLGSVYLLILAANLAYNSITSSNLDEFGTLYGKYIKVSVIVDENKETAATPSSNENEPKKLIFFSNTDDALDWIVTQ